MFAYRSANTLLTNRYRFRLTLLLTHSRTGCCKHVTTFRNSVSSWMNSCSTWRE